jgi:two-component system chemotaxis response regulator CheB
MIVDDSLVIRKAIRMVIEKDPVFEVVAVAGNGQSAIDEAQRTAIDIVILDIEMPIMDGLTALPKLLEKQPQLIVIVASTLTMRNADISIKTLILGAKDYIHKPSDSVDADAVAHFSADLINKMKALLAARERRQQISHDSSKDTVHTADQSRIQCRPLALFQPRALVIGSSTGGPNALSEVLRDLKGKIRQPIFITQHMPPNFTTMLAKNIEKLTGIPTLEATHNLVVQEEHIYIAPGDYHMTVVRQDGVFKVQIDQDPHESYSRPSVSKLFRSAAQAYEGKVLATMLTGLGSDGLEGSKLLIEAGGMMVAQDEATSVVWGMPKAVAEAGLCSAVLPLPKIGPLLQRIANSINPKLEVRL